MPRRNRPAHRRRGRKHEPSRRDRKKQKRYGHHRYLDPGERRRAREQEHALEAAYEEIKAEYLATGAALKAARDYDR